MNRGPRNIRISSYNYERIIEEHFFFKFDQYRNKARLSLLRWQNGKFTETLVVVIEFTKAFT